MTEMDWRRLGVGSGCALVVMAWWLVANWAGDSLPWLSTLGLGALSVLGMWTDRYTYGLAEPPLPGSSLDTTDIPTAPHMEVAGDPHHPPMHLPDALARLNSLILVNRLQLLEGVKPISGALDSGELRCQTDSCGHQWNTIRGVWSAGGGDSADLAAAIAAELQAKGTDVQVLTFELGLGRFRCVVVFPDGRQLDPAHLGQVGGAA